LRYQRHIFAGHGEGDQRPNVPGKKAKARLLKSLRYCGYDAHTGEYLCDITDDGQEVVLLKGGVVV
jgi:GTP-binding protein